MTKKEKLMKPVDNPAGLMECLVCSAQHNAIMKPGPDGKYLGENRERAKMCTLIHPMKYPLKRNTSFLAFQPDTKQGNFYDTFRTGATSLFKEYLDVENPSWYPEPI